MHLAFFVDQVFWRDGAGYSSDEAYTLFPTSFCSAITIVRFFVIEKQTFV